MAIVVVVVVVVFVVVVAVVVYIDLPYQRVTKSAPNSSEEK